MTRSRQIPQGPSLCNLPPQSIEAEEALLSAILLDNKALSEVIGILTPADFYKTVHQVIFSGMIELFEKNEPVDLVTLSNALREGGKLETVGGATFLARLVDSIPLAVNVEHYAKIVHEKACLRRLIEKSNEISRRCFENQGDVEDVIDFAQSAIFDISENKIKPAFYPLEKIIEANIDMLVELQGKAALVTGVPTGFALLDNKTAGLQRADLIILAARPSMGKTALALNIARNAAVDADIPVAIFSIEMSKEQLSMRMLCAEAQVDSARVRGGYMGRDDWQRLTDAASLLSEAPIYIDDSPDISALEVRAKARRLKMEKKIELIIIDYLQLMKTRHSAERRDLEISELSRSLKSLAKELNIPVLALSQLNRQVENRSDKRPQLSDLRESGALEQDADVVAFIYRDEEYNKDINNPNKGKAEIIIAKQRNGPTGVVPLAFLKAYTLFKPLAREEMIEMDHS